MYRYAIVSRDRKRHGRHAVIPKVISGGTGRESSNLRVEMFSTRSILLRQYDCSEAWLFVFR